MPKIRNVNAVDGKLMMIKMARVHFESGIVHELYERPKSESFIEKPCVLSELPTELEDLRKSPALTVKTVAVGYVNVTSNWISEIQQCF